MITFALRVCRMILLTLVMMTQAANEPNLSNAFPWNNPDDTINPPTTHLTRGETNPADSQQEATTLTNTQLSNVDQLISVVDVFRVQLPRTVLHGNDMGRRRQY